MENRCRWAIFDEAFGYCQNINIYVSAKNNLKKPQKKQKTKIEEMKIKTKQYINLMWYDKNNHALPDTFYKIV